MEWFYYWSLLHPKCVSPQTSPQWKFIFNSGYFCRMLFCDVSQGKSRNRLHMITLSFQLFGMENSKGAFVPTVFFQKLYFFFQLVSYFVHVSNSTPSFSGVDHFSRLLYLWSCRKASLECNFPGCVYKEALRASVPPFPGGHSFFQGRLSNGIWQCTKKMPLLE